MTFESIRKNKNLRKLKVMITESLFNIRRKWEHPRNSNNNDMDILQFMSILKHIPSKYNINEEDTLVLLCVIKVLFQFGNKEIAEVLINTYNEYKSKYN